MLEIFFYEDPTISKVSASSFVDYILTAKFTIFYKIANFNCSEKIKRYVNTNIFFNK